jgi:transposase
MPRQVTVIEARNAEMVRLRAGGLKHTDIAAAVGCSRATVENVLRPRRPSLRIHKVRPGDTGRLVEPAREIDLTRAIGRFCEAHHGFDVFERNASRAQKGVDVVGNRVWRVTPPVVITDEVRHREDGLVAVWGPSQAEGAQLSEVRVISGIGSRYRSASNQGSANHHGDGKPGQPAR